MYACVYMCQGFFIEIYLGGRGDSENWEGLGGQTIAKLYILEGGRAYDNIRSTDIFRNNCHLSVYFKYCRTFCQ